MSKLYFCIFVTSSGEHASLFQSQSLHKIGGRLHQQSGLWFLPALSTPHGAAPPSPESLSTPGRESEVGGVLGGELSQQQASESCPPPHPVAHTFTLKSLFQAYSVPAQSHGPPACSLSEFPFLSVGITGTIPARSSIL